MEHRKPVTLNCSSLVGILVTLTLTFTFTLTQAAMTSKAWRKTTTFGEMTGQELKVTCRSRSECAALCEKESECTAFVYNSTSGACHVLPHFKNVNDTSLLTNFFQSKDAKCTIGGAPNSNGTLTTWTHTMTSLRGEVPTCLPDYVNTTTSGVILQCDVTNGTWTTQGRCAQRVWRNPPLSVFPVPVPLTPVAGWTICVEGVPTVKTRFTMDLISGTASISMHVDIRMVTLPTMQVNYTVATNFKLSGTWGTTEGGTAFGNYSNFPFAVGVPFLIRIVNTGTGQYEVYKNKTILTTFTQHPSLTASVVTDVNVRNDVSVTKVDLLCTG